jgi:peptidoglycan/xylan/chitin deacetylase (PgdA/CDA1 family)
VLPLEECVERSRQRRAPPRAVCITFDDGYRDNYENAFPVLRKFGLCATVFLATGSIESGKPLWYDLVFDSFRRSSVDSIVLGENGYRLGTVAEKRVALDGILRNLRRLSTAERDEKILKLLSALKVDASACRGYEKLGWREIEEMCRGGIRFGAHTVTHPILTSIPLQDAIDEIRNSRRTIEDRLGTPVRTFAYPNGGKEDFSETVKRLLKEEGFVAAVTTLQGNNDGGTDPLELRRYGIWDHNPHVLGLRLGWYKMISAQ